MPKHFHLITLALMAGTSLSCVAQSPSPGFDCSKATVSAEKMVCSDNGLAALDRQLTDLYRTVEKVAESVAEEKTLQRKWIAERNACAQSSSAHDCIQASYQRRIIGLQIRTGEFAVPKQVEFACGENSASLTAVFYNDSDPKSAVLTYGNDQTIVLIAESGSGARYTAPDFEFWDHHGEAMVTWRGKKFTCAVRPS